MTAASPAAPPPVGENGVNHAMNMPRFHPIAINPNNNTNATSNGANSASSTSSPSNNGNANNQIPTSAPPPYRSTYGEHTLVPPPPPLYHPPSTLIPAQQPPGPPHHPHAPHAHHSLPHPHQPPHQQHQHLQHPGGPPPPPSLLQSLPTQLDHIEARLRQIEHEESTRAAARAHTLSVRKREDEEFRLITERAEAEEEELRRRRKRLKRESMGLTADGQAESPPAPPSRRLSETSAATTLAFFKQQSPPEPRPQEMRPPPPAAIIQQQQQQQQQPPPPQQHHHHHQQPPPPPPATSSASTLNNTPATPGGGSMLTMNGPGPFRKKQKYTIKNAEAWGERHGRPATRDPNGRALWKRPSDGQLVYLDCPSPDCGKSDFLTLHGFMCHLTKKHKDRSMGSQSRALDLCGTVYDPSAPRAQGPGLQRGSTEGSRAGSMQTEEQEDESMSGVEDEDDSQSQQHQQPSPEVKKEDAAMHPPEPKTNGATSAPPPLPPTQQPLPEFNPPPASSSNKASIASMIDSNVRAEAWRPLDPAPAGPSVKEEPAAVESAAGEVKG